VVPVLDLPSPELPSADGEMIWCDGFEIETVISCRVVAAGLKIAEVPSMERSRLYGQTNLRTFVDGYRVLRTIMAERQRAQGMRKDQRAQVRLNDATANESSNGKVARQRGAMLPEKSL
jgi:hypothetical protein